MKGIRNSNLEADRDDVDVECYTVSDLVRMTEMPAGEISKLVFSGMVEPQVHRSNGSGDPSLFGNGNVSEIVLISRLQSLGVKRAVIKDILATLAQSKVNWWKSGGWLVGQSGGLWVLTDNVFSEANRQIIQETETVFIVRIEERI